MLHSWVADGISRIIDESATLGIRVLPENTPTGPADTGRECVELLKNIGADRLGLCYDVANGFMVENVVAGLQSAAPWLRLVHLSDTTGTAWRHDLIGNGDVPFHQIRTTLDALGYGVPAVLETLHEDDTANGLARDAAQLRDFGWLG